MKVLKRKEPKFYKIKVNKKDSNNQFNISQNDFNNRYKFKFLSNTDSPNKSNIFPYYQNNNIPYFIIKNYKPNSNSEEKIDKNKNNIYKNNHHYNKKTYNYIGSKENFKNSIINQEKLNQNFLFLDELNNNNINIPNNRKIYRNVFDSEYIQYNKNHNLSMNSNYINDENNNNNIFIYKNNEQPIEKNKINNFIKEFKLINNYYENDNRYIINNSLDNRHNHLKNSRKNKNNENKNSKYMLIKNINNDINKVNHRRIKNYNNNYQNKLRLRNTNNNNDYLVTKINSSYNNSYQNLKINNFEKKIQNQSIYIKSKSPYKRNEYYIKYNNNSKEDNYKKLFNQYRGKLIQEFMRHFKKAINKYLLKELKNIMNFIDDNYLLNNENYIFEPKITKKASFHNNYKNNVNNSIKLYDKMYLNEDIRNTNKINDKKYIKIFYSEKKLNDEMQFKKNLTSRNVLNINPRNFYQNTKDNINNQINCNNPNKLIFNNRLIKFIERSPNSKLNFSQSREIRIPNSSNISINDKNYIYRKKISKNYALNIKKEEKKPLNIIPQKQKKIKGRIIDIDINLGRPIKEISDMSLIQNFNKNKNSKNKNNRNKKRAKSRKKLSLPKKIYLEEGYDINYNNNYTENNKPFVPYRTYSYENKKYRINNLINLNRVMETNEEKNIESITVTEDKLLFIRVNILMKNNDLNKKEKYKLNSLEINKNEDFCIGKNNLIIKCNNNNRHISSFSLIESNNSRNNNLSELQKQNFPTTDIISNKKDKYLLSCIKFMIKIINKIFLNKEYIYFKKYISNIKQQ